MADIDVYVETEHQNGHKLKLALKLNKCNQFYHRNDDNDHVNK